MKKLRKFISFLISITAVTMSLLMLIPLTYGGASPAERILRLNDGGKISKSLTDSMAIALACNSGTFDFQKDGQNGYFVYRFDNTSKDIKAYWQLDDGNNRTARYILIKDGVRYQFSMDESEWHFDDSRVCLLDVKRLAENLAKILTNRKADTAALKTDLNALTGLDLSKYINFETLPVVIRTFMNSINEDTFQQAAGYSFSRNNFTLQYHFSPTDSSMLAQSIHAIINPAYTKSMQNIISIAGIAGGLTDLFGFDLYDILFDCKLTMSLNAFTGKLTGLEYESNNTSLSVTNIHFGGCDIQIISDQLDELMATHIKDPVH